MMMVREREGVSEGEGATTVEAHTHSLVRAVPSQHVLAQLSLPSTSPPPVSSPPRVYIFPSFLLLLCVLLRCLLLLLLRCPALVFFLIFLFPCPCYVCVCVCAHEALEKYVSSPSPLQYLKYLRVSLSHIHHHHSHCQW